MAVRGSWIAGLGLVGFVAACGGQTDHDPSGGTTDPAEIERTAGADSTGASTAAIDCTGALSFSDPALEAGVRDAIGVASGAIRHEDVAGVTELELRDAGITELGGVQCLTNLNNLFLRGNSVSDLHPLAQLQALQRLSLAHNSVSDLSPLAGLRSLRRLNVVNNAVSDLSSLAGLSSLEVLSLASNAIHDLSPLAGLTRLTELSLPHNSVADLGPLVGLTSLRYLYLADNVITDLGPLASLSSLEVIDLNSNQVADLGPLVQNPGFGSGDGLSVYGTALDCSEQAANLQELLDRGVLVSSDCGWSGTR